MLRPGRKGTSSLHRATWKRVVSEYPLCKSPDRGTQLAVAVKVTWSVMLLCARVQSDGQACNGGRTDPIDALSSEAFEVAPGHFQPR